MRAHRITSHNIASIASCSSGVRNSESLRWRLNGAPVEKFHFLSQTFLILHTILFFSYDISATDYDYFEATKVQNGHTSLPNCCLSNYIICFCSRALIYSFFGS